MTDDAETRVLDHLAALGVDYDVIACDPELADTARFCEAYGVAPERSANAIVVKSKRGPKVYCLCLVTATCKLDVNHAVRPLLGAKRASFASPEETRELTGMMIGGVSPFGIPADLPIYIDRRVMEQERVVVGGGSRSIKIDVAPSVFEKLDQATVVDGLAQPVRAG